MKRLWVVLSAALVVGALGLFVVGAVSAQGPSNTRGPHGAPWGRAWGHMRGGAGAIHDTFADLLGLTPEQLWAERSAGKTLAEIAAERGVDEQALRDARSTAREAAIEDAVAAGRLSQSQAERLLQQPGGVTGMGLGGHHGLGVGRGARGMHGAMRHGSRCGGNSGARR